MSETESQILCSFCGKNEKEARRIIAGPGVFICDSCIDDCQGILSSELRHLDPDDDDALAVWKAARPVDADLAICALMDRVERYSMMHAKWKGLDLVALECETELSIKTLTAAIEVLRKARVTWTYMQT